MTARFRARQARVILTRLMTPAARVQFAGQTECRRDGCGPLGLILCGHTAERPHELVQLAFSGRAPQDLPRVLQDPLVEHLAGADYRITSGSDSWRIAAGAMHLHRDVTCEFYRAIAARPLRRRERLFWRAVLMLAASSFGRRLLTHIRR
jgi:hypothetical protein